MTHKENLQFDPLHYIMLGILFILVVYFTTACKTIEYLPGDTIREIEYKTKFEKEIVRFDSIITKTDTFANIVFRDRTVFQTKENTKIDSIYLNKEVIKMNPVNDKLQKDNDKLTKKNERKNKVIAGLIAGIILLFALYKIFK